MEIKGGMFIWNGDKIEKGGLKIVYGSEKRKASNDFVSDDELQRKINYVKCQIDTKRHWFSVLKYMMWHKIVVDGDFRAAIEKLETIYPGCKLDLKDMQRLNTASFAKTLDLWDIKNSPVDENAFTKYYSIAQIMESV